MFDISKFLAFVTHPLNWAAALLVLSLLLMLRWRAAACWTLSAAVGIAVLVGWMPLPNAVLNQLESRYPVPDLSAASYHGMVVLGGSIYPSSANPARSNFVLSGRAERMTVPVELQRQYPHLMILFTAGEIDPGSVWNTPANPAQQFYASRGVPLDRVMYERVARTTYENAILSAAMPGVDQTRPWLLVTSAWHMPRSMALFRAAGWNVTPYPVDFRGRRHTPWTDYSLARGKVLWRMVLHEVIGMAAFGAVGLATFCKRSTNPSDRHRP